MYSVKDLMYIHERIGIPIVFDYHHHKFCTGDLSEREKLDDAYIVSTWDDITPVVHYSESRSKEQLDESIKPPHSDYVIDYIDTYASHNVDIMVEAKTQRI